MDENSKAQIAKLSLMKNTEANDQRKSGFSLIAISVLILFAGFAWYQSTLAASEQPELKTAREAIQSTKKTNSHEGQKKIATKTNLLLNHNKDEKVLDASGHIIARRVANISSRVTSKVEEVLIEEGQLVEKNAIVARLDSSQAEFSYEAAKATLDAGKATYQELSFQLQFAQLQYKRIELLYAKKVVSEEELETLRLNVEQFKAKMLNRVAQNQQAVQQVNLRKYNLEAHTIRAPFTGVIIKINAQEGELISAGMSGGGSIRTGIATIVDMESLEIDVDVSESHINRVKPGQQVNAYLEAYPDWQIKSEVLNIIPTANRQKATIKVRIKLLQTDPKILPDMAVKTTFLAMVEHSN